MPCECASRPHIHARVCTWHAIVQMEVRTVLWTAEVAVCESMPRVEAACGVTWTLLKGGKGRFLEQFEITR